MQNIKIWNMNTCLCVHRYILEMTQNDNIMISIMCKFSLEIQLTLVIKNDECCRQIRDRLAQFYELQLVHPALQSR